MPAFHPSGGPFAAKYFCFACNIDETQGVSPWNRRHGPAPFAGIRCPFGALVGFLPPKPALARFPKFGPRGTPVYFLGFHCRLGGRFSGECLCIKFDDLAAAQDAPDGTLLHARVHRVKEVSMANGDPTFPAQEALTRHTRQLAAPTDSLPLPLPGDPLAGGGSAPS